MPVTDSDFLALLRRVREASADPEAAKLIDAAMKPSRPLQLALPPVPAPAPSAELVMLFAMLKAALIWEERYREKKKAAPYFADVFLAVLDDRMARPADIPGADQEAVNACRAQALLTANAWSRMSDVPMSELFEERLARRTRARRMGAKRVKAG